MNKKYILIEKHRVMSFGNKTSAEKQKKSFEMLFPENTYEILYIEN